MIIDKICWLLMQHYFDKLNNLIDYPDLVQEMLPYALQ